jgi:chemotaxis protein MotB
MKTTVAVTLLAAAGMLTLGGCVPKAEYDKALKAARLTREELESQEAANQRLQAENNRLKLALSQRETALRTKEREIQLLENARDELRKSFLELKKLYDDAVASGGSAGPIIIGRVLPQEVDEALKGFAKEHPDLLEYLPAFGMVKIKSDLTFAKGSDDVRDQAKQALLKFAKVLQTPEAKPFHLYIAGHTDDIPIKRAETKKRHPTNWYLSVHRAVSVQQVLVHEAKLDADRIGVVGFGKYHPVAPNQPNQKGNEKNRRVELWVVPPDRLLTPESLGQPAGGTDTGDGTDAPTEN